MKSPFPSRSFSSILISVLFVGWWLFLGGVVGFIHGVGYGSDVTHKYYFEHPSRCSGCDTSTSDDPAWDVEIKSPRPEYGKGAE